MKKKICISIENELLEKLKRISELEHRTQTAIIELALIEYFKKPKK